MKAFEIVKILKKNGWVDIRQEGSHHRFRHAKTGKCETFAYHTETEDVGKIKAMKVFKQFGINPEK